MHKFIGMNDEYDYNHPLDDSSKRIIILNKFVFTNTIGRIIK